MANETLIRVLERKRKFMWPEAQLNLWLIVMIASAATILGVFIYFMVVQARFQLNNPWYDTLLPPLLEIAYTFNPQRDQQTDFS